MLHIRQIKGLLGEVGASYDMLLIGLIWNISGKIGLLEVSRNFFFAECMS